MVQFGCCGIAKKTKGKKLFVDTDLDDDNNHLLLHSVVCGLEISQSAIAFPQLLLE